MAGVSFLSRLSGRFFHRHRTSAEAGPPAQSEALPAPEQPAAQAGTEQTVRRLSSSEKIELLLDALHRQQGHIEGMLEQFAAFLAAASKPAQEAPPNGMQEALKRITERDQEVAGALQDIASEAQKQTDALSKIQASVAEGKDDSRVADAMNRLAEVLENAGRSNAAHVELMEQIRDRLAGTNYDLAELIRHHQRRFARLLLAVCILLGGVIVAIVIQGLLKG